MGVIQSVIDATLSYWQNMVAGRLELLIGRSLAILVVMALTYLLAHWLGRAVRLAVEEASDDRSFALLVGRLSHLGVTALGTGWILSILGVPLGALAGFFGFFGLGMSLSFADVVKSLLAGALLFIDRPYGLGDTITVRGMEGIVEDLRLRTTRLRLPDGRAAFVPNAIMLTDAVVTGIAVPTPDKTKAESA